MLESKLLDQLIMVEPMTLKSQRECFHSSLEHIEVENIFVGTVPDSGSKYDAHLQWTF